jgi:hypothetical protein
LPPLRSACRNAGNREVDCLQGFWKNRDSSPLPHFAYLQTLRPSDALRPSVALLQSIGIHWYASIVNRWHRLEPQHELQSARRQQW